MKGDQRKSGSWNLFESGPFLFFLSALVLTFALYFPTVIIFVLLWILYFYLSSSTKTSNENIKKKEKEEEEYYKILKILDNDTIRYPNLINELKKFSNHEHNDNFDTSKSLYQTSNESLYILLEKICKDAKEQKKTNETKKEEEYEDDGEEEKNEYEFNFDSWLKEYITSVLPPGTEDEFKYYVKNNRDEIIKKCGPKEKGLRDRFELIINSKPKLQNNLSNKKDKQEFDMNEDYYPKSFQKESLKFDRHEDHLEDNKTNRSEKYSYIKKEHLWDLIRGNATHFISFDYSCWYPKDANIPFWLIPFSLYRWWTPENDSFIEKFILFSNLDLADSTKKNMLNDILYFFLLAYAKKINKMPQNYEIAGISTLINNKFEAYCLVAFLKAENIINADQYVYDDVVSQCINYLIEIKKFSWPLSAFTLNKENDLYQLEKLLESYCDFSTELSNEENIAIETYDKESKKFNINREYIYEIKGEKFISKAIHEFNRNDFHQTFENGIYCLIQAKKYSRAVQLITDCYLKWMSEVGNITGFNDIFSNLENALREEIEEKTKTDTSPNKEKAETKNITGFSIMNLLKKLINKLFGTNNSPNIEKDDDNKQIDTNTSSDVKEKENELFIEYITNELENSEDYFILDIVNKCINRNIIQDDFIKATQILTNDNKPYNIRRFILSLLTKQDGWEEFAKGPSITILFNNIDSIPGDEILYYQYINDLNSINQLLIEIDDLSDEI